MKKLIAAALLSFLANMASAQIATFTASGTVYFTENPQPISIGDSVFFSTKIDLGQIPSAPGGAPGTVWQLSDMQWSIGSVHGTQPFDSGYLLLWDLPGLDQATFSTIDGDEKSFGIVFNYTSSPIPSIFIPTFATFNNAEFTNITYRTEGADFFRGSAFLTSFTFTVAPPTAVPEPSTYGLIASAMLVGAILVRRRRFPVAEPTGQDR